MKKDAKEKPEEWGVSFLLTYNAKTYTDLITNLPTSILPYKVTGVKTSIEVGDSGNLHSHTYVNFERSQRKSSIINKLPTTDVKRVTSGTERTVINYIGNTDKEISKGCTIIDCYQYGDIATTQGTRTDLTATDNALWEIKDAIDAGESMRYLYNTFFPYMIRHGAGIRAYYDFNKAETGEEKVLKYKENTENDIAAMEKILLDTIKDKAFRAADNSKPYCLCGAEMEWNNINREYECRYCQADK